ncbi:hypothetical protein [Streptomyces megasporus]|uniref:hypothetical protein n=1 Tax=Streptomyces megasporus TaxID=44060 RepID=UPI00055BB62C|nr:hypothetical protein [Streptomyces megasporus]
MTDPSPRPGADDSPGTGAGHAPDPGIPRWVKISGITAAALVALAVLVMLLSGGEHGPGRHLPSGAAHSPGSPHGLDGRTLPADGR